MNRTFSEITKKALWSTGIVLYAAGGTLVVLGIASLLPVGVDGVLSTLVFGNPESFSNMFYERMGGNVAVLGEYANAAMRATLCMATMLAGGVSIGLGLLCQIKGKCTFGGNDE